MISNILNSIVSNKKLFKPVIYGIKGTELTDEEKSFFQQNSCLGFILFARNIVDKTQVKKLTNSLRELMDGEVLILIDQEGGRVARLKPPIWDSYPTGKFFADLYLDNPQNAREALFKNYTKIAQDLNEIGINVNCAPVLDVLSPKTHQVIGDRAFGDNPEQVATLGQEVCNALLNSGVFPVIKHIPGHGRGACDSHLELPIVEDQINELKKDFIPFQALNNQKFAMTAHILFKAIDPDNCVTFSKIAIDLIRYEIGFKNILMSDDLSMKALAFDFATKTKLALKAGCDLILHCNGNLEEMHQINSALPIIDDNFKNRFIQ